MGDRKSQNNGHHKVKLTIFRFAGHFYAVEPFTRKSICETIFTSGFRMETFENLCTELPTYLPTYANYA